MTDYDKWKLRTESNEMKSRLGIRDEGLPDRLGKILERHPVIQEDERRRESNERPSDN